MTCGHASHRRREWPRPISEMRAPVTHDMDDDQMNGFYGQDVDQSHDTL